VAGVVEKEDQMGVFFPYDLDPCPSRAFACSTAMWDRDQPKLHRPNPLKPNVAMLFLFDEIEPYFEFIRGLTNNEGRPLSRALCPPQ
jgi:hypothetical protein